MSTTQKSTVRKFERRIYKYRRGVVRLATVPFRGLSESSSVKHYVRRTVLRVQHSLPTELAVRTGETVVQVGTPNPATMLRFARRVGQAGRLVIFEAMPANQDRLERAIRKHGVSNVVVVRAAACNENRVGLLAVSPLWGDHKIPLPGIEMDNDRAPENSKMPTIEVEFVRLDDALPKLGVTAIDYLSITVNGAEHEVLKGAREILKAGRGGSRVYAKGHAREADGTPVHVRCEALVRELGYESMITRGEPSSTEDADWRRRDGDLYAWKPSEAKGARSRG